MTKRYVYLAGPIAGCTEGEAKDWRRFVCDELRGSGIVGISPLRFEKTGEDGTYPLHYNATVIKEFKAKNFLDIASCDLLLAFMPKEAGDKKPSYSTVIEMSRAHREGKPIILVSDDPQALRSTLIRAISGWVLSDLSEALKLIHGLFDDYVGGE